jgi:hypothetical protein
MWWSFVCGFEPDWASRVKKKQPLYVLLHG